MNISELNEFNIFEHYQKLAGKTLVDKGVFKNKSHCILGLIGEYNELIDAIKNVDSTNIKEELGDMAWFIVNIMTLYDINFEDVQLDIDYYGHKTLRTEELLYHISELANEMKRELIFDKPIVDYFQGYVRNILAEIESIAAYFRIPIEETLISNLKKLENRNKNKGIGDMENRDLTTERNILEQ